VRAYLEENFTLAPVGHADHVEEQMDGPASEVVGVPNEKAPASESSAATTVTGDIVEATSGEGGPPPEPNTVPTDETYEEGEGEDGGASTDRTRTPQRAGKPSIMERFAAAHGFRKDGEGRFFHSDGSWIARTSGDCFPWVLRTAAGDVARYYWPKDHCLDSEPLVVETDVWGLIDGRPEVYALVLVDADGEAIEMTGIRLHALREQGRLKLYPAAYRLVVETEEHA